MSSFVQNIAFDCADPYKLASFWSKVVDRPQAEEDFPGDPEAIVELVAGGLTLFFQRVPEEKSVKNRVHVCLRPSDRTRDEEVGRLLEIGAGFVSDQREPDGTGWVVLADPEGNEFCVLRSPGELAY
ncbi:hypothetical protein SAMN05421504_10374 [Amycolatopsis xylanica]|uniref:Glyoxalase-like domain-containing protein n=1 Tax=Amycolatopsis xylanica TaxID=589385 RepID=A0A1H3CL80_9PSEU|nr:VOC family protein [Amycolatopsis xylanica]SDX54913.1 hypothetical protein SAMN05421504_10374 [Amycolatopsis xylanica]